MSDKPIQSEAINANSVYPLRLFQSLTRLRSHAYRAAVKRGLRVARIGRKVFVNGSEFMRFCDECAERQAIDGDKRDESRQIASAYACLPK